MVVERPVEVSEPLQDLGGDARVWSALGFPQAARPAAPLGLLQAGEPFSLVEVEVLVRNDPLQAQEVLNATHLPSWVGHQPLAADKQELGQGEVLEPVLQVLGVEADAHGVPRGVDQTCGGVPQGQALEGREAWVLGQRLCVVGHGPSDRVPHYHDQLGLAVHGAQSARGLLGNKVARGLLHGDLAVQGPRHQGPARGKRESDEIMNIFRNAKC